MRRVDRFHRIPPLYRLRCERKQPMTRLVAEAIEQYLAAADALPATVELVAVRRGRNQAERPAA